MHCVPENTDIRCCSFHIYQLILIIQEYGVRWEIKMPFDSLFSLQCFCQRLAESDDLHTHARAQQPFFRDYPYPGWGSTRKVKPIWIFLKQETVSGMSWAVCKSAPRSRQITTPATHHSVFLQAECPFWRPTNSVKALNGKLDDLCRSYSIRRECRFGGDIV